MYEGFFQFQSRPFPSTPVVANYFPSQSIEAARQNLTRAIERVEGPGLVVGPAGVGKTLLLRVLAEHFAHACRVVMLSGTRVTTRKSLLQSILFELEMPYRGMDEGELRLALIDALRRNDSIPHGILLLIDESHTLPLRLLDEARLITNVVHDGQPRVRLVLAGSPQLEERFTNPKLESFNQRIAARCYLQALTRDETHEYVRAELSWAGGDPDAIFPDETVRAIFLATDGIPRLVNQVCDHALIMAHANGWRRLEPGNIQEAWADLQQLPPPWQQAPPTAPASVSTVIEFGQLDDAIEQTSSSPLDSAPPTRDTDLCVAQNDSPCDPLVTEDELQTDCVLINPPYVDGSLEWVNCGQLGLSVEFEPHIEANPFQDTFDEEIVIIDRMTARCLDGFRGRPRVSCPESRELATILSHLPTMEDLPKQPEASADLSCLVSDCVSASSFEFSTLEDLPEIDSNGEFPDELATITSGNADERIELDFDEEVDCVPLPWMRGALGDDRDIIIVEDDEPHFGAAADDETSPDGPKRAEYRELFAQLRRAST